MVFQLFPKYINEHIGIKEQRLNRQIKLSQMVEIFYSEIKDVCADIAQFV